MDLISLSGSTPSSPIQTPQTRYREALSMSPTERGRQKVLAHSPRRGSPNLCSSRNEQPAPPVLNEKESKKTSSRILEPRWTPTSASTNSLDICSLPGENTASQRSTNTRKNASLESGNELSLKYRIFPLTSPLPRDYDSPEQTLSLENESTQIDKFYFETVKYAKKETFGKQNKILEDKKNIVNRTVKGAIAFEQKHKFLRKSAGTIYSSVSFVATKFRECNNNDTTT